MKQILKNLLFSIAPRQMAIIQSIRARNHSHTLIKKWGLLDLNEKLKTKFQNVVQFGTFAGMKLPPEAFQEHVGPFLLGTYEAELFPAWKVVLGKNYTQIIDIGCKFGYYAVGLAIRYPNATVHAFDIDPWAKSATGEMAKLNSVKNLQVHGFCDGGWIQANLQPNAFMISDCEGYEKVLFSNELGPNAKTMTAIIETHDCLVAGASKQVRSALESSHSVATFCEPWSGVYPFDLGFLTAQEKEKVIREIRPEPEWLLCLPNAL